MQIISRSGKGLAGMETQPQPRWSDYLLLPVLYFCGAKLGVYYTVMSEGTVILWPPAAVLLASLIIFNGRGYYRWIGLALIAEVLAGRGSFSLVESLLFGVAHIFEATLAFTLLSRQNFSRRLDSLTDLPTFVIAGPVIAAGAAALMGATIYAGFRSPETRFLEFFRVWWFGDALGLLIFTPLLLSFWHGESFERPRITLKSAGDLLAGALCILAVILLIRADSGVFMGMHVSAVFLLPFILYLAVRSSLRTTAVAIAALSLFSIYLATNGHGTAGLITSDNLLLNTQEFIFVTSLIGLGLASLMLQIRRHQFQLVQANKALQELNHTLELRIQERTTKLESMNEELEKLALCDPLTGLLNRRGFMDLTAQELSRIERHVQPVSLISVDIDHFKAINDQHGHQAGDQVLQLIAAELKSLIRSCDILGRFGGEEFMILAPGTDLRQAEAFAERMRRTIETADVEYEGTQVWVTASFGVAQREGRENFDRLSQRADQCLYRAKELGRNRVVIDPNEPEHPFRPGAPRTIGKRFSQGPFKSH